MKKARRIVVGAALIAAMTILMIHPQLSSDAVKRGLQTCASSVLPSLFPFFVFSNLWTAMGYAERIGHAVSPLCTKLFHLPGVAASVLMLGITGGYPVGVQSVVRFYKTRQLSKEDAEHLLCFCNNAGPAFLVGVIGGGMFQNAAVGLLLWLVHILSAMIIGFILRNPVRKAQKALTIPGKEDTFSDALVPAIRSAGTITLQVCTFVVFFSFAVSYLQAVLPETNCSILLLSSVELASAAALLPQASLSQPQLFIAAACLLGWGGVCVHCQSLSMIRETDLSVRHYFLGKVLHAAVSTACACITLPLLPEDLLSGRMQPIKEPPYVVWRIAVLLLVVLFVKSSTGKQAANQV